MALFDHAFAPYVPFGSRTLVQGNTGTDVAIIQAVYNEMLKTMNPPQGPMGLPVNLTGTFDAGTTQAVKNIQSYFGLPVTGTVAANTYLVFGQGVGADTTYGGPVYGSRSLVQGDTGGDVTILQNRLNCFRYARMIGQPATGSFDTATAAAVLSFKQDAVANGDTGFPPNSVVGFGTYDATWIYTFAGGRAIFAGRNGFDVVFLQAVLHGLGYYSGALTGYDDANTQAAIAAFQSAQGITSDSVVGPETFYHIGLRNDVAAPAPIGVAFPPSVPPPPPTPDVTVCSVALTSTTSDAAPYGVAAVVANINTQNRSLDVVVTGLGPPPAPYEGYAAIWSSVTIFLNHLENPSSSTSWGGHHTIFYATEPPTGPVTIQLWNASTIDATVLLEGHLSQCH